MDRREYLRRIGAATSLGIAALAGCGAPGDGGGVTPEETATDAPTATAMPTETDATTATPGETDATTETGDGATPTATGNRVTDEVAMLTDGSEYLFDPIGLYVEPGEEITWVLESGGHSATAYTEENPLSDVNRIPAGAEGWNSGTLTEGGAEFSHVFEVEGTYDYYCIPHKSLGMVARLVVGEPSGLEGDPPDGPVPSEQRIVEEGVVTQEEFNPG